MSLIYHEIKDQYRAMEKCARYLEEQYGALRELVLKTNAPRTIFLGCGSSFSLAKSMADTVNIRLNHPAFALPAGDAALHARRYAKVADGALIVPISRSGSTSEIFLALDALRSNGCAFTVLSLSCVTDCRLSSYSALSLEMPWCFDESVCQTRTVSCLYYSAMYVIAKLAGDEALVRQLSEFPALGERFASRYEKAWEALAGGAWDHAVVLADAEIHGLAEEGALAFKEVCQLQSNCYHLLDVRHGPMVLIRDKTLVIAALTDEKLELDLIGELKGHGAIIATVSDRSSPLEGTFNYVLGEDVDHIVRGLGVIALCQLVAFYKSKTTGTDPDHPTGLDAWIKL